MKQLKSRAGRLGPMLFAGMAAVMLVGVPTASAQDTLDDPSSAQYDPPLPEDTAGSSASGSDSGLNSDIGSLPFTGMDLLIVVGIALLLTGMGFALRRLSARPQQGP